MKEVSIIGVDLASGSPVLAACRSDLAPMEPWRSQQFPDRAFDTRRSPARPGSAVAPQLVHEALLVEVGINRPDLGGKSAGYLPARCLEHGKGNLEDLRWLPGHLRAPAPCEPAMRTAMQN